MNRHMIPRADTDPTADVCLIVEGCYPFVRGGVSSWVDWLVRSLSDHSFHIVSIWPKPLDMESQYALPANALSHSCLYLHPPRGPRRIGREPVIDADAVSAALLDFIDSGDPSDFGRIISLMKGVPAAASVRSRATFEIVSRMYDARMPQTAFLDFFWAWRSLFGGLFATLEFQLPRARVYHAISTGYAGLVAARARIETGRPVILTEHGIYTNERRMEILMADWISDSIDKGLALHDPRPDLRDMWIAAFESYARACYAACDEVITLYSTNQILQRELGAPIDRLRIIPNGVDVDRFARLTTAPAESRPTIAFIGRVAPIKDVATFIEAAAIIRDVIPDLRGLILGPTDEDPAYFRECERLSDELDAARFVKFMGSVSVAEYLPTIHVVVLTSLSEAQPLVLLEAGAAGVPCVTTDVGACREILEGRSDEIPNLGPGGIVTDIAAPEQIATAAISLLNDSDLRRRYGMSLRQRVAAYYSAREVSSQYADLYDRLGRRSRAPLEKAIA